MPHWYRTLCPLVMIVALSAVHCAHTQSRPAADSRAFVEAASAPLSPTHGLAIGDVGTTHALVWSRTSRAATMHVRVLHASDVREGRAAVDGSHDFTGTVAFDDLQPDTRYDVEVWFEDGDARPRGPRTIVVGSFRTAPDPHAARPVRFAFGGDVAGQNVCRDRYDGFPIFRVLDATELDFFVALGDMVYADGACRGRGRYGNAQIPGPSGAAADLEGYWARWRYARGDPHEQALYAHTPLVTTWDDHEIEDDFDPRTDANSRRPHLPAARQAFFDWNPVRGPEADPTRIHRSIRWGRNLELFVLDTRQYRDPDRSIDDARAQKTMLGEDQRAWLEHAIAASDATWKVVVSSVTIAVPSGDVGRRDGWASAGTSRGFETELRSIFASARDAGVTGLVFVSADVHFGAVFRHTPFAQDPWFAVHELVAGPLHARSFPVTEYDRSFGSERLFYFAPDTSRAVESYEEAKAWMNFAALEIAADGELTYEYRNAYGEVVHRGSLRAPTSHPTP